MSKNPPRIYWDANAWIAYIRKEMPAADNSIKEPRYDLCREVLAKAERGEVEIVTSAFTLSEVCKRRSDATGPEINLPAFFDQRYILVVPVDKQIGLKAQHLQLSSIGNLKPADATHAASAMIANVYVFHTFDGPLRGLDRLLTTNDGKPIRIVKPGDEVPLPPLLQRMQDDKEKNDEER